MRIYLGDLGYMNEWEYAQVMPLSVGLIASYLSEVQPDVEVEIFKDPLELLDRIELAPPDILGLSQYTWNLNLNFAVTKKVKQRHPNTLVVFGGPNFNETSLDWIENFFSDRPQLDLFIVGEGEPSFSRLVALIKEHGSYDAIPRGQMPSSFFSFDRDERKIINNPSIPMERIDLSEVPSPYLSGIMDRFLADKRLCPIIETSRGCPYSCAFCCWGATTKSKLYRVPTERVIREIRYIAERTVNRNRMLYLADSNFGIFKDDRQVAEFVSECSEQFGFPQKTYVYYAKNTTQSVIDIAGKLKDTAEMSMSMQSMNIDTLDLIKRSNISHEKYNELSALCRERGIPTFCELIYGLPGESYESFVNGVISTVRSGQNVFLLPLRMDSGSELASSEARNRFGVKTAFRVLHRYVGEFGDIRSMEFEELVVANNDISEGDYEKLRQFHFVVYLFNGPAYQELVRALKAYDQDFATLAKKIVADEEHWSADWRKIMEEFKERSRQELIPPEKVKLEFTTEDLDQVRSHELALNVFFAAKIVSDSAHVSVFENYLSDAIDRFFVDQLSVEARTDIKNALALSIGRLIQFDQFAETKAIALDYDVDAWLAEKTPVPLSEFRTPHPVEYEYFADPRILPAYREAMAHATDIVHAIYMLRVNILPMSAEWAYCYDRRKLAA